MLLQVPYEPEDPEDLRPIEATPKSVRSVTGRNALAWLYDAARHPCWMPQNMVLHCCRSPAPPVARFPPSCRSTSAPVLNGILFAKVCIVCEIMLALPYNVSSVLKQISKESQCAARHGY